MINKIIYFLTTLLFGERASGEKISQPTLRTTYPVDRPEENQWNQEVKFGSRYGHKGSFYNNTTTRSYF